MSLEPPVTLIARLARRPVPILMGIAVGFLACCVAGRLAAQQQPFENFVRFHQGIALDSHFYPPCSQVLNLARSYVQPGKVLVVIGGSSILLGVGQRESQVWTRRLQELLGEDYVVLNLALRGNHSQEFGGVIAERLVAEGVPLIYVTTSVHPSVQTEWDGNIYRYFFWDAWGKGLLPHDERRDHWLDIEFFNEYRTGSSEREYRDRGLVDGIVYSCDLWNAIAYKYVGTVWSSLKYPRFWEPHRNLKDNDPGETLPFEIQNNEQQVPVSHKIMMRFPNSTKGVHLLEGEIGGENDACLAATYRVLPAALVDRTLVVFRIEGVYYRQRLSPEDLERLLACYRLLPQAVARSGYHTQLVGEGYAIRDYADMSHFSEQGGRRVAADLAPTIRSMAAKLYGTGNPNLPGGQP